MPFQTNSSAANLMLLLDNNVSQQTKQWKYAFQLAKQCLLKFQEPVTSIEEIECKSYEAINLLTKRYISHYNFYIVLHQHIKALLCYTVLVFALSHMHPFIQGKKTHQVRMN